VSQPIAEIEAARRAQLQTSSDASLDTMRQWRQRQGIGLNGAWWVGREFFGWRAGKHRRAVGGVAGCTPTPSQSGESARAPGSTQSGTRHVRWMTTEGAWRWRRFQPDSALSVWLRERCGGGGTRLRRLGIGAGARKVLMALWRVLEPGAFPAGAVLQEGSGLFRCEGTARPWYWWRRPVEMPGLLSTPS
jgi:transposase